jgi:uncharacterized membrane protein YjgN (DUF898 family)
MSIVQRSEVLYTGRYDFNTDGGAIGTINLGVPITYNCCIYEFSAYVTFDFDDGGLGAMISFDLLDKLGVVGVGVLMQPRSIVFPNFTTSALEMGTTADGVAPNNKPFYWTYESYICMSISAFPLIAGACNVILRAVSFESDYFPGGAYP